MKKTILIFLAVPMLIFAQEARDTATNKIVVSEDVMECINNIYDNPDAIKLLLKTLAGDKEKLRALYKEIINDPALKGVIKELRSNMREDSGKIEEKKKREETDINREEIDYAELKKTEKQG